MTEFVDVVIVGAGFSGISAAWHLQQNCPGKSYVILERRDKLGGTWDLFKYPGIRSDSDMYTLGFHFKPWATDQMIADGPSIWNYLNEAATENGIAEHIRYGQRVTAANWSGPSGLGMRIVEHLEYTAVATFFSALIAVPIGMLIGHTGRGTFLVVTGVNALRALPTLGVLLLGVTALAEAQALAAAIAARMPAVSAFASAIDSDMPHLPRTRPRTP